MTKQIISQILTALAKSSTATSSTAAPRILGIVGPPGSGKSTVTDALATALPDNGIPLAGLAPMDGFHLSNSVLTQLGRRDRKGAPDTFDTAGYVELLRRIRTAEHPVYAPEYRRDLHEPIAAAHTISPTGTVIAEGNYLALDAAGWSEIRAQIDFLVFLEVAEDVLLNRLVKRQIAHGADPAAAAHWVRTVDAANIALVRGCAARCDLVIST